MAKTKNKARAGVALLGIGAIAAASLLPGSLAIAADSADGVHTAVTRAVLAQGNANGELNRSTLVTQIQLDGDGQAQFQVPVREGVGAPKDMDAFGGPNVTDGEAKYDMAVDGPQTLRTQQTFEKDDIPVKVDISATLDGQTIDPSDLAGQSGLATLTYTLTNTTSEPTEVSFLDATGNTITQEMPIVTPMAGALNVVFNSSWTEIASEQADAVAQNGQSGTTVGATVPLMSPPIGASQASVVIEGRVAKAVVPPVDLKVAIIAPIDTSSGQQGIELAETTGAGLQTLYDGMGTLISPTAGLGFLATSLGAAVTGADQLAAGVDTLFQSAAVEGHTTASGASKQLVDQARNEKSYKKLLGGFDTLNKGLFTAQSAMAKLVVKLGKPLDPIGVTSAGNPDLAADTTTIGAGMAALLFGITQKSADFAAALAKKESVKLTEPISGLTNPNCDYENPTLAGNPCGAWQALDVILQKLDLHVPEACQKTLLECAIPANSPGAAALLELLVAVQVDPNGYTGDIGQDTFQGLLKGNSILQLIQGHDFGSGVCDIPGYPKPTPPALVSCGGTLDLPVSKLVNIALVSGQFAGGLAINFGQEPYDLNNAATTLRGGIYKIQQGLVQTKAANKAISVGKSQVRPRGWPNGCDKVNGGKPTPRAPFGCELNATKMAIDIIGNSNYDAANIVNGLAVLAIKTSDNPTNQLPEASPFYVEGIQFGVCPGGYPATTKQTELVRKHCSATQALQILQEGLSGQIKGWPALNISVNKVDKDCPVVSRTPWIPPKNGTDNGTTPSPPDPDEVKNYGAACAVQVLQQSIDRILMPTLGNGVQKSTLTLIGSGLYTPNCDPNVTKSLSCALSVVDMGTRKIADGLPAAAEGTTKAVAGVSGQIMPGINENVETANESVAVVNSLSDRAFSGANVPGGAAVGVSSNQGIYAFEFAGAGGPNSDSLSRFGLAALFLLVAAGAGFALNTRKG